VKLINTDGMAFIGPGSEWFWTALSGIVLAVTFLAIYRQLATARSIGFREELDGLAREWQSERLMRYRREVMITLRDAGDDAPLPQGPAGGVADYWEKLGELTRRGHLDATALHSFYSPVCQAWWAQLAPHIRRLRADYADPHIYEQFEWLVRLMADLDHRTGRRQFDLTRFTPRAASIAQLDEKLRIEESLRSVTFVPGDAPVAEQPRRRTPSRAHA
jgi:hypothetical protein